MKSFLEEVAADMWQKYGSEVSDITMLFPSRRAGLYFRKALSALTDRPLWQPRITSIGSLMEQLGGLATGDRIRLNAELFKIYSKHHPEETFDGFYYWGEMLVGDFDTVDKYLIDASMLFTNLADIHDLDSFNTLTDEQIAIIRKFWESLGEQINYSEHKKRFVSVWSTLAPIYKEYRSRLSELGFAYEGMVYRQATEMIAGGTQHPIDECRYAVVGFNALSECERRMLEYLKTTHKVDFYWDYDKYYTDNNYNEAGDFMRRNIESFPDTGRISHDNFATDKSINVVAAPSDALQCKYVNRFLKGIDKPDIKTAIVLTDENLLLPTLYSLPENVDSVNITMGYPIRSNSAYTFTERLIELQRRKRQGNFYHSDVTGILKHPYIVAALPEQSQRLVSQITLGHMIRVEADLLCTEPLLAQIFTPQDNYRTFGSYLSGIFTRLMHLAPDDNLRTEFFTTIASEVDKLTNSVERCGITIEDKTFVTLLRKVLQTTAIPFEGEPLAGVQIMGFLESRALDFENVAILSMSDDHCPGNRLATPSFIPYNLRKAYGLPTPEQQEAMYAYYFARLVQRASHIDLVYCSRTDENNSGEASRYISQLSYESPHKISRTDLQVNVMADTESEISVAKTGATAELLAEWIDNPERKLSHTRFFKFIECPLKFYFESVAGLKITETLEDRIDGSVFGSILHESMQKLYEPFIDLHNPQESIRALIGSDTVGQTVAKAVNNVYLGIADSADRSRWGGTLRMIHDVVSKYINTNILPFDATKQGYTIKDLESLRTVAIDISVGGEPHKIYFKGTVDRIDRLDDGTIDIIDYKTGLPKTSGKDNETIADLDTLFHGEGDKRISAVLQTLLYSMMLSNDNPGATIRPNLYYVKRMAKGYSSLICDASAPQSTILSYADYDKEFRSLLKSAVENLFDTTKPFTQGDIKACTYCDFASVCHRKKDGSQK